MGLTRRGVRAILTRNELVPANCAAFPYILQLAFANPQGMEFWCGNCGTARCEPGQPEQDAYAAGAGPCRPQLAGGGIYRHPRPVRRGVKHAFEPPGRTGQPDGGQDPRRRAGYLHPLPG